MGLITLFFLPKSNSTKEYIYISLFDNEQKVQKPLINYHYFFQNGGMKDADYIVAINEEDVKWSPHDHVVSLIKRSGNALKLRLITPLDSKKENSHKISIQSSTEQAMDKIRGSSSPTSSTSGHSSGSGVQSAALPLSSGYVYYID